MNRNAPLNSNNFTAGHSGKVRRIVNTMLNKITENEQQNDLCRYFKENKRSKYVRWAAQLHDIGKLLIKNEVLFKKERLNTEEQKQMNRHPEYGKQLLKKLSWWKEVEHMIMFHHILPGKELTKSHVECEKKRVEILLITIADILESLTSVRPYPKHFKKEEVIEEDSENGKPASDISGFVSLDAEVVLSTEAALHVIQQKFKNKNTGLPSFGDYILRDICNSKSSDYAWLDDKNEQTRTIWDKTNLINKFNKKDV